MEISQYVLRVNEIFYSVQGEGGRSGKSSIFIRLAGCNLKCPFCDTEFAEFTEMNLSQILTEIQQYAGHDIVWTGGEPTLQLNEQVLYFFKSRGYLQAIETNGTNKIPHGIDYVAISPKQFNQQLIEVVDDWHTNNGRVDEIRIVYPGPVDIHGIYDALLYKVGKFYLSPEFVGEGNQHMNEEYVKQTVNTCLSNPQFSLSIQMHKLISVK